MRSPIRAFITRKACATVAPPLDHLQVTACPSAWPCVQCPSPTPAAWHVPHRFPMAFPLPPLRRLWTLLTTTLQPHPAPRSPQTHALAALLRMADDPGVLQHLRERQAVARRLGEQLRGHAHTASQQAGCRSTLRPDPTQRLHSCIVPGQRNTSFQRSTLTAENPTVPTCHNSCNTPFIVAC